VLRPCSLSVHEKKFYNIYANDLPTPPDIVRTFQEFKHNLINRVLSYRRVYELEISLGSSIFEIINQPNIRKKIVLQFIYHPSITSIDTYLIAFDIDVIQICFDDKNVLCTWACIRALNTGTFICYNLTNNLTTLARTAIRISKYYQKGFKLLYPYEFAINDFLSLTVYELKHTQNPNYYSSTKEQFGSNHDYFRLQKNLWTYISLNDFKFLLN
ncbi:unnamed protein product, partial [Rotaria sp. Silwood2]